MNQIACFDWLPEWARLSYLAHSGLPAISREKNFPESQIINPLLTKLFRSRWLDFGLVLFFCEFMDHFYGFFKDLANFHRFSKDPRTVQIMDCHTTQLLILALVPTVYSYIAGLSCSISNNKLLNLTNLVMMMISKYYCSHSLFVQVDM